MKVPYEEMSLLIGLLAVGFCKYDIRCSLCTNHIHVPFLNVIDNKGMVYPMFSDICNGWKSLSMNIKCTDNNVQLVLLKRIQINKSIELHGVYYSKGCWQAKIGGRSGTEQF